MTVELGFLIGLAASAGMMLLVRDWRPAVGLLLIAYVCATGFLAQQPFAHAGVGLIQQVGILPLIEALTGLAVTAILVVTGLTFSQDYNIENLDEFGLMELRRAARRAARLRVPRQWNDYLLPASALVVVAAATVLLPRLYPTAAPQPVDYAWTLLLLAGLLQLLTTQNMIKLGAALLLIALGLEILYIGWSPQVGLLALTLLNIAMIVLALVVAYLSGMLYGRLKTLELTELYRMLDREP